MNPGSQRLMPASTAASSAVFITTSRLTSLNAPRRTPPRTSSTRLLKSFSGFHTDDVRGRSNFFQRPQSEKPVVVGGAELPHFRRDLLATTQLQAPVADRSMPAAPLPHDPRRGVDQRHASAPVGRNDGGCGPGA